VNTAPGVGTLALPPILVGIGGRVDEVLEAFLSERRAGLVELDPSSAVLIDEIRRLLAAGGKRLRPGLCYLGYRAAGGDDGDAIVRAAAALELLHTFALVHDDVMDDATERRGVPTTSVRFADELGWPSRAHGRSVAIVVGDLASVLAASLLRGSGFSADRLAGALDLLDRMQVEMAAGQYLDLLGAARRDLPSAEHVAELKTGSYTFEGPLLIGAALAGASPELRAGLSAYGRPAGEAFQLRDDVLDREAVAGAAERVNALADEALAALPGLELDPVVASALGTLGGSLRLGEA
jgi:geranylgeranyl diphosphate synthase type I